MLYKRGKGAALSAAVDRNITQPYIIQPAQRAREAVDRNVVQPVQEALTAVGDHVDSEYIEPHDRRQLLLQNIAQLYAEHEALIQQLRDIDQFAFFAIQNTWDLAETTWLRRVAQNPTGFSYDNRLASATNTLQQRNRQLHRRISSLTTPRRLDFGGTGAALSAAVDRNITQPYIIQPAQRAQEAVYRNVAQPVQNALTAVGDTVDSNVIEPYQRYQVLQQSIQPLFAEYNENINQLRAIDQLAWLAIRDTWDWQETQIIERVAQGVYTQFDSLEMAANWMRQRIIQLRQRISSLTTPRRLNFGGKLTKRQKTAIGTTAALAGLAGMAAASASYNKPPPALRARAQDTPDIAVAKRESMARAERNSKRMQQLHEAQQRSWEKSLYPSNKFYDAETW